MMMLVLVRRRIRISRVPDRAESIVDGDGDRSCCAEATFVVAWGFFSFGAALVRLEAAFLCVVVVCGFVAGELDCLLLLSQSVSVCQPPGSEKTPPSSSNCADGELEIRGGFR
jgi:hypothetical protein